MMNIMIMMMVMIRTSLIMITTMIRRAIVMMMRMMRMRMTTTMTVIMRLHMSIIFRTMAKWGSKPTTKTVGTLPFGSDSQQIDPDLFQDIEN